MISKPIIKLSTDLKERLRLNLSLRAPRWIPVEGLIAFITVIIAGVLGFIVPLALLLFWSLAAQQQWMSDQYLPAPALVWQCLLRMIESGELWFHIYGSLVRLSAGLLIGIIIGAGSALLFFYSSLVTKLFYPIYTFFRQIPLLAFIPLLALWLSNDIYIELLLITLAAFYPVFVNTYKGLQQVDKGYRELGQLYGFSRWLEFRKIILPASLPRFVAGLVTAVPLALLTCIGSELLLDAGAGIGGLMRAAQAGAEADVIIVCIFVIALLSMLMNFLISRLSRYVLRWRSSSF